MTDVPPPRRSVAFPDGLPLVRPWLPDQRRLRDELARVVAGGMLTNGPRVRRLEEAVAARLGVDVVAVSSCTAGLALVWQAVLSRPGAVVLPSSTFAASAHAVHWAGGTPRWAEIDPRRLTLDPRDAEARVDGDVVGISATHVHGAPVPVEALQELARRWRVPLVLDAAHALGSSRGGVPVGRFGVAEVFSLSPTKVTVAGEGGLVATRDDGLVHTLRLGRDYGNPGSYDCLFPGLNARMSELHAAVALHSLHYLDESVARRNALVRLFAAGVAGVPGVRLQHVDEPDVSTYKDLTVVVDEEVTGVTVPELADALRAEGVDSRRYYHPPIHRQQAYRHLAPQHLPVTDRVSREVLTLPLWSHMEPATVVRLADVFVDVLGRLSGRRSRERRAVTARGQ